MRIFFIIRSLDVGGAERQLVAMANELSAKGHSVAVAVFYAGGELEKHLSGVRLINLAKQGRWDVIPFIFRLISKARQFKPDILYSMLGTANILSIITRPWTARAKAVWGIRSSNMDLSQYDTVTRIDDSIQLHLSRFADLMICNSNTGLEYNMNRGFAPRSNIVIENGTDTRRFKPDDHLRAEWRKKWEVTEEDIAIGLAARIDPMKDHATFLKAIARIAKNNSNLRFFCIGGGDHTHVEPLKALAGSLGISNLLRWTGHEADMVSAYNGLDVLCLTSITEGFPNVIAEAMACGTPCVATDVGDVKHIIADTGNIIPVQSPAALAEVFEDIANDQHLLTKEAKHEARSRIVEHFSLNRMAQATEDALSSLTES